MTTLLSTGYDIRFIALSVFIAVLASYTAIDLAGRVSATRKRTQIIWLSIGAIVMGIGIWSMHFVGMLAFHLPVRVHYNFVTVLVSMLPAVLTSGLALYLVSRSTFGGFHLLGGSLLMGLGIASMHYIGMDAMHTSVVISYDPLLVAASIGIAIAISVGGLYLVHTLQQESASNQALKKVLAALIMGAAIPAMHYTGMAATHFEAAPGIVVMAQLQPPENALVLAVAIVIGTLIVVGLGLLAAFYDRRLSAEIVRVETIQAGQAYLGTVLEGIRVGVLVIEDKTQVRLSNRAAVELLQLSSETELQSLWQAAVADRCDLASKADANYRRLQSMWSVGQKITARQAVQNEVVYLDSATSENPVALLVNVIPLDGDAATAPQMICTLNDITELKQAENRLKDSRARFKQQAQTLQKTLGELQSVQSQLVQSEKMSSLGQLVAGVAHEINNPVNFIHGNLTYVEDYAQNLLGLVNLYQQHYPNPNPEIEKETERIDLDFVKHDFAKVVNSMQIGTERICKIVLSLRNFSRKDEAEFKLADIHEGIESTLTILQHRLENRPGDQQVQVIRQYADLPPLDCYPGQLNQVFMNILANAIDAVEEASSPASRTAQPGQITIRTAAIADDWVEIAIADNGPGIPAKVKQRIFDPFFTTKTVGKGTGMGLSISYQVIVERHSGYLECQSQPGQGTEFVIRLPVHQAQPAAPTLESLHLAAGMPSPLVSLSLS